MESGDDDSGNSSSTAAILLGNSSSPTNVTTPSVAFYPMHSFTSPTSATTTIADQSINVGRSTTSRTIRFSLDSDQPHGQLMTVSVPSTNNLINNNNVDHGIGTQVKQCNNTATTSRVKI